MDVALDLPSYSAFISRLRTVSCLMNIDFSCIYFIDWFFSLSSSRFSRHIVSDSNFVTHFICHSLMRGFVRKTLNIFRRTRTERLVLSQRLSKRVLKFPKWLIRKQPQKGNLLKFKNLFWINDVLEQNQMQATQKANFIGCFKPGFDIGNGCS